MSGFFAGGIISIARCAGSFVYVVTGDTFIVYDASSPENPVKRGACALADSGSIYDVSVEGNIAFLAGSGYALQIIDIGDADRPAPLARYCPLVGNWASKVAVAGDYAYVTVGWYENNDAGHDIHVVDVSHKNNPVFRHKYRLHGIVDGLTLSGKTMFVSNYVVRVLDISKIRTNHK